MTIHNSALNPALTEYSRYQNAPILPTLTNASILDWLETTGRLLARDGEQNDDYNLTTDEEIEGLMVDEAAVEDSDDTDDEFDED